MYVIYYLIFINILSFILYFFKRVRKDRIISTLSIISLLGGNIGIILNILLFDKKTNKDNLMIRIISISLFVIYLIIYLIINTDYSFLKINNIYINKFILYYLIFINIITFITFGIDKHNSKCYKRRIKINTLLLLSVLGGSIGSLLGMFIFNHKTRKNYFRYGIPIIIFTQAIIIFYYVK